MQTLSSKYMADMKKELMHYGFRVHKKSIYRAINDVVQSVHFQQTRYACTFGFTILPLSYPINYLDEEGYDANILRDGYSGWWELLGSETTDAILEDMLRILRERVVPMFEKGNNSKDAYDELIKLEKTIYTMVPGGVRMNSFAKVCFCLKNEDYAKAYEHMAVIMKQNETAIFDNITRYENAGDSERAESYKKNHLQTFYERKEFLRKLSIPDVNFIKSYVIENEEKSRIFLEGLNRTRRRKI